MVVLVNEEIDLQACFGTLVTQKLQLLYTPFLFVQFCLDVMWQQPGIHVTEGIETGIAMGIERTAVVAQVGMDDCKI